MRPPTLSRAGTASSRVVPVVALLAQRRQVEKRCSLGTVVEHMGAGQHDNAPRERVRLAVFGVAPFAPSACAVEPHEARAQRPVLRVSRDILRADRHERRG